MAGVRGQGRKFDLDQALDVAMEQFWRHGYEGTSIARLTEAIGIAPPSLYVAFGGKEQLFDAVVAHYLRGPGGWMAQALEEERSPAELVRRLLYGAAVHYADPGHPGGCLIISSAGCVTEANEAVARKLREQRNSNVARLAERLAEAPDDDALGADPRAASDFVGAVVQGMSTRARDGATVEQLTRVADLACAALGLPPAAGQATAPDRGLTESPLPTQA